MSTDRIDVKNGHILYLQLQDFLLILVDIYYLTYRRIIFLCLL